MANSFSVDDTSPAIAYFPFADTITTPNPPPTPNLTAGWNPYIVNFGFATSPGLSASGVTQHITSRNASSLTLLWHGTSIQLFGNTTSQASYSLQLDGVTVQPNTTSANNDNLLAFLDGLPDTNHSLVLTANIPEAQDSSSMLVFDRALIKSPPPEDFSNITFSDRPLGDNTVAFQGPWTLVTSTQPPIQLSEVQGDLAEATFSGISVRIFGTTSPTSGNYSVTLDGTRSPILSAKSSFINTNVLLFFASGLEANTSHHIQLRNEGGGSLSLNSNSGFDISSSDDPTALPPSDNGPPSGNTGNTTLPPPPNSPSSGVSANLGFAKGTIAALVLSGFLAFVLLTGALFYFCVWRPRRRRRRQQHAREIEYGYTPAGVMRQRKQRRESLYPREKDQEPIVGNGERGEERVLDIGHEDQNQPGDTINTTPPPIRGTNSGSENGNAVVPIDNRSRRGSNRSGFARWKRDINALSGLTTLGLKFRHSDSAGDEKSPGSPLDFVYHPYGDVDMGHGHGGSSGSGNGSGNGFIYGRYDPEVDGGLIGAGGEGVGGMGRLNTRSSNRSLRFGRKRSGNTLTPKSSKGKGKLGRVGSTGFSFRLSPHSRYGESSGSHPDAYDPYNDFPPRDRELHLKPEGNGDGAELESLSGLTSLSYASNPNAAVFLDAQPPSYAASVSQSNDTSSHPSVPRSVTRSPQSQSRNTSGPPSPLDAQGSGPQYDIPMPIPLPVPTTHASAPRQLRPLPQKPESQPHLPSQTQPPQPQQSSSRRTRSADDTEVHDTGRHILSIGGGLAGVGGPISVRAAIRGLSPRISKSRRSTEGRIGKGKGKERQSGSDQQLEREREVQLEREKQRQEREKKEQEQQQQVHGEPSSNPSRSGAMDLPPPPSISTTLLPEAGSRTGSPIRALPPIPIPPAPSSSQPQSKPMAQNNDTSPTSRGKSQRKPPPRDPAILSEPPSASFLNVHPTSPLKLDFEHLTGTASTSVVTSSSSSPTTSSSERKFKGRSSLGDAAGLGSPGAVQSFAEAAAIAATPNVASGTGAGTSAGEVHAEGGPSSSGAPVGDGDEPGKSFSRRQSGASRVHFEDDTTSASASPTNVEAITTKHEKGTEGKGKGKGKEKVTKKDKETKWRFRLTPPSGQSPTSIEAPNSDSESKPAPDPLVDMANTSFLEFNSHPPSLNSRRASGQSGQEHTPGSGGQDRIWSMQLPGRDLVPPVPPIPGAGLKSKWSNTTMQTHQTQSSSTDSGNGSEAQHLEAVQEVSRRSNIFPFPLAIPPSPNMPEGFAGVEPSPSLMSPSASLPVPGSSKRTAYRKHPQAHSAGPPGTSSNKPEDTADAGGTESPTDSFPYSISDIHFRNSLLGSDSDPDLEPGQVQFARRRSLTHPPLPSTPLPLTPQRFNPGQEQQQQQHSATSSIVQRVFGSRSGSAAARTPPPGGL